MSYTETTYNHDYNATSPRHQGHGDFSPRADQLGAGSRYYKASPREDYYTRYRGNISPTRHVGEPFYVQPTYHHSPHGSPRQERHQMQGPPDSYRSQNYDNRSPQPYQTSPRNYEPYRHLPPKNDPYRHLPPKNDFSVNSTTQHDYGDFTVKQAQVKDIRMKDRPEPVDHYGRRQERPYFNDRDPPSFYKSPRDRVPPTFQNEGLPPPDMDRWERERRMNGERDDFRRQRPPSPKFRDNPMEDMAAGQLRKEMKRIELHEGNFKPYTDHKSPRARKEPGGVYLFIRNNDAGFFDVKKAYESHTGGTPERRLEGVADANHIRVKEGGRGWKRMATVARWEGSYYDQEVNGPVDQMLSLMWFPSIDKAREWVDRDVHFKHSSFPEPYGNVTSVLPTQYPLPFSPRYNVFMLTEFTKITSYEALDKYLHDIEDVLKKFDCDPFFINCTPVPIKSTLFDPKSRVVCHRFRSLDDANYFFDGPVTQLRKHFAFAEMTTVIFVLGDIHGK